MNALTTVNAKFMVRKANYGAMNLSCDTGLMYVVISILLCCYFTLADFATMNLRNLGIMFCSGALLMGCWLVGCNCSVKGIAGPTIAIIYTSCFYTTLLQVIFQGLLPSMSQLAAAGMAFTGVLIIIFFK